MLLIENGTVYTPTRAISDGVVLVDRSRIHAVGKRGEVHVPAEIDRLDVGGGVVAPGLIDMHVHGVGGYGPLDGSVANLHMMALLLTRHGVTSFAPTFGSAPLDAILRGLEDAHEARRTQKVGAQILGVHMEGPYMNPAERGAMPLSTLRLPEPEEYARFLSYADDIAEMTLAPELPGAVELIQALRKRGILAAAGHSIAIDSELERAVEAGLSHATHLFCNMGTLRRVNIRRVAGMVESVLLDDRITAEIITDGYHIAPSLMKLALKVKGPERLAIVTDGSHLTGMPPGRYTAFGREVIVEDNITYVSDRSAYAGSVATMDRCLRCAIESMDLPLPVALRMASLTPATILGVADRKGSLEPGKDADIVIFDSSLHVKYTLVGGRIADVEADGHSIDCHRVEQDMRDERA